MQLRSTIAAVLGAGVLAAAAAYAPSASADNVGFSLSIGGPGYGVSVGNYGYGYYDYWRPAPVYVAPYVPVYRPRTYYYYDPVAGVHPRPVYRQYRQYDRYDRWRDRRDGYDGWRDRRSRDDWGASGYVYSR